jgi:prepilin-type N-terminal cleavage/methylation domain-containing protein
MAKQRHRKRAFTLIELLLAISIIVLVAGMIVPMVSAFSGSSMVEQTLNEVRSYLLLARQQAVQYHRPVAVFFLPPTDHTPNSRMMLFELRGTSKTTQIKDWRVIPGEYGSTVRRGIEVRKRGDNGEIPAPFCIAYTPSGFIDDEVDADSLSLQIGPRRTGTETAETHVAVAVNRSTGTIMKLRRRD